MKLKTLLCNNKKVIKKTKANGEVIYSLKGAYLGLDQKTGKQVTTTITAKTLKVLDRSLVQAKLNFEKQDASKKKQIQVQSFEDLAEVWFQTFTTWVASENTLNRVRGYLDTYMLPRFGNYKPEKITSSDIQIWVNELAVNAQKRPHLTKDALRRENQKILAQLCTSSLIFLILG